jgi:uncharacterized membrane protein YdjX (TVP38/TMEM64 family)
VDADAQGFSVRLGLVATLVAILAGAALVLAVPQLRDAAQAALSGDADGLRAQLREAGAGGIALLLGLMLLHAVVWYPAEIPTAAAGFVYGFWVALPLMVAGWLLSALGTYALGRHAGRPQLHRLAGPERFGRAEAALARGGAPALLAARLIPIVPFSLVGLVAGAARVPLWRFAWTTVVGFLPLMVVMTLLGSRLEEPSLRDPVLWLALVPVVVLLAVSRPLVRRMRAAA